MTKKNPGAAAAAELAAAISTEAVKPHISVPAKTKKPLTKKPTKTSIKKTVKPTKKAQAADNYSGILGVY